MKLLFERSRPGRGMDLLPPCDVPAVSFDAALLRDSAPRLPEIAEVDLGRHYTELAKQTHGVNDGFYPLGSCTMKYNPRVDEETASLPGFTQIHPLQPLDTVQGCLEVLWPRRVHRPAPHPLLSPVPGGYRPDQDHRPRLRPRHQPRLRHHGGLQGGLRALQ